MVSPGHAPPLHVGFSLATLVPHYVGGAESYARGVLDGLSENRDTSFKLRVIANRSAANAYRPAFRHGVSSVHATSGRFDHGYLWRLLSMVHMRLRAREIGKTALGGVDVIHYPLTVPLPHGDLPRVVTLFDMQHHEHPEFFGRAELLYRRMAYDGAARRAARVITLSRHARDEIVRRLGVDPERIDAIAPGIDHARFRPGPVEGDEQALT